MQMEVETTMQEQPPYYSGPLPLTYRSCINQIGFGPSSGPDITLWSDFGTFRVSYSQKNERQIPGVGLRIPASAVALDVNGRRVATAQVLNVTRGVGIEIEEIHYSGSGGEEFRCKSKVAFHGAKVSESEAVGRKTRDYFFLWPC